MVRHEIPNAGSRRFRAWQRGLLVLPALFLLTGCAVLAQPGLPQERPEITIEDVVHRGRPPLATVGWLASDRLYAQMRSPTGETSFRVLERSGPAGEDLSAGFGEGTAGESLYRRTSIAPGGAWLISHAAGLWTALDTATQTQEVMEVPELPAEIEGSFAWHKADWAADGRRVAISEMYDGRRRQAAQVRTETINGVRLEETAPVTDEVIVQATRVIAADLADSKTLGSWIFTGCTSAGHSFSPGPLLYVTLTCFEDAVPHTKLMWINLDTGATEEIYRADAILQDSHPRLSPDGRNVAFALNDDGSNWAAFMDLAILDASTGEILQRLRPGPDQGLTPSNDYFWAADGRAVYVRARAAGLDEIWSLSLSGQHRRLAGGERRRFGMSVSPDGSKLSYTTLDGYGYRDVRTLDVASGEETVYAVIDDPAADYNLGKWEQIEWASDGGIRPKGWLFTPPGFDPERRYPLFVYVHGNGTGSDLYLDGAFTGSVSGGPLEWHAMAAMGYLVFVPDYRMSGNYGPGPIRRSQEEKLDGPVYDARDVITGIRHVVSLGSVDPGRIAIMGHSAGGTRTFKALTDEPDLFAAGILNDSSPLDLYSVIQSASTGSRTGSDFNRFMRRLLGPELSEEPEPYKANYVLDAVNIRTPTLFLRGGYGGAVSPTQYVSHELAFTLIRQAGVPAKYITFLDQGHTYTTPEAAIVAFDLVTDWLAEHMPVPSGDRAPLTRDQPPSPHGRLK